MIKGLMSLTFFLLLATGFSVHGQAKLKSNHQAPARSANVVKRLGVFTNMRFTTEHQYGYSVELWQERDRLFGLLLVSEGLSGDTPTGLLEDVVFNPKTGRLTFSARLSTGSTFNKNNEQVPTRDAYRFNGTLKGLKLTGVLEHTDALARTTTSTKKNLSLRRSKSESESMIEASSYDEWKKEADEILKLRGPKW
ncbi:MAG: hypothetical protein QOH49_1179 [Acidobacteriota bacterium]|nr:hypothetical protein [Acidobacteriota bacterium]